MPKLLAKAPRTDNGNPPIQSLDRGLIILETVGRSSSAVTLRQLADVLGIDRSSAFRLANTLKRRGFLSNPAEGKDYVLGSSLWRLSRQYDWSAMLATISHKHLRTLAAITGETAHLAVREGRKALFIDHAATSHVIAISGQTGEAVPLYCTSHGKALLADFEEKDLRRLFGSKPLPGHTKNTLRTIADLTAACAEIRARGYATDDSEFMEGVRCVAAPIRDKKGSVVASIGVSAPTGRFPAKLSTQMAGHVTRIAALISAAI